MSEASQSTAKISEIADVNPENLAGNTPNDFTFRYVDLSSADRGNIDWNAARWTAFIDAPSRARRRTMGGDVLFGTVRPYLQSHGFIPPNQEGPIVASTGFSIIRARPGVSNSRYLFHSIMGAAVFEQANKHAIGSNYPAVTERDVSSFRICTPSLSHQSKIAEILDTLDEAIRGTEAVVAKLKAMKQGLLHDLLTRGIAANGDLRPSHTEAPHLYRETPLGWLPKEWEVKGLGDATDSIIDGPFGSNLKTEHYVEEPGVRVVRLQNIQDGYFDNTEKAYIRESHAAKLARNEVVPGDVLIASLGDDAHPVARSCQYPFEYPSAINKADCFRLRGKSTCRNGFVTLFLNSEIARRQARGYEQGVTMKRINLGNLRKIKIWLPKPAEQEAIEQRAEAANASHSEWLSELVKLRLQKSGLMHDLLTGRVSVTPLL